MTQSIKTVSVVLPVALDKALTYGVSDGLTLQEGDIVEVSFGRKDAQIGVVWSVEGDDSIPKEKLKYISCRRSVKPLSAALRRLIDWVADYTLSPRGNVLKMVLSSDDALKDPKPTKKFTLSDLKTGKLTASRQKVAHYLQSQAQPCSQVQIKQATGVSDAVIRQMAGVGMLEEIWETCAESTTANVSIAPAGRMLSPTQQEAANVLIEHVQASCFQATLLDGVTGSGKTEVYFQAIRYILEENSGQAVVLLPEIALTTQLLSRVQHEFGINPVVWHSNITPSQKAKSWRAVQNGMARLVIGARSALFLPYQNLKLIVVDEEHDPSFKQEEGVLYQARDIAVMRASLERIPIVLASATPSLETMVNVEQGKYQVLTLPSRFGEAVLPDVEIVDMRQHRENANAWISAPLKEAMASTLAQGKQVLLFLNRRGYAPLTLCRACGHRMQCPHCSAWLVEHRAPPAMLCHHCGYKTAIPNECPECHEKEKLAACGPGVERLQEEAQSLFPQSEVAMLSSESASSVKELEEIVGRIESGAVDIIIGTQMVAKGHHFPALTLVGVVDADLGLAGGDLRAAERTYQLLHQVSGRAGREKDKGKVLVQSYMPENMVIQAMAGHHRDAFMKEERASREFMAAPPFGKMAGLIVSGKHEQQVKQVGLALAQHMPRHDDLTVLGPAPAPLSLVRQQYRYRVLLKSTKSFPLQKAIRHMLAQLKLPSTVRVKVDIDPYSFM